MTNRSSYLELQQRRAFVMESYIEVSELFVPLHGVNLLWVLALIFTGWLLSLLTFLLTGGFPLWIRKPNKAIFFAAFQEKLRKTFKCQSEETFNTILMGANRSLTPVCEGPTVLMVLAPSGAMAAATQLVTLLVHCVLIACRLPASLRNVKQLLTDGNKYTSHDDEWPLFYKLRRQLCYYGVAAVFAFDSVDPHVVKTLQQLLSQVHAPYPESLVVLVVDLHNRFTEHQQQRISPNILGQMFLQDQLGLYFDQHQLSDTINLFASRCILIHPES